MILRFVLTLPFAVAACQPDETVSGFASTTAIYRLVSLDGATFAARATISFPQPGQVAGNGPCNSFTARQNVPYPWVEISQLAATKKACPDLAAEQVYFDALADMTLIEVSGPHLILSTPEGRAMAFQAEN